MREAFVSLQHRSIQFATFLATLALLVGCGAGSGLCMVSGTVSVDGTPVDAGTISLRPKEGDQVKGVGGAIENGVFQLTAEKGLPPGTYDVFVLASKRTGRVVKDPQRGEIAELKQINLQNSPQEIQLDADNASELKLEFISGKS
jgi:hypothetical protein